MGLLHRTAIALTAAAGWLGLTDVPDDDPARVAAIAAMYSDYQREFPEVPAVDVGTVQSWIDAGRPVVLVDVRSAEERAVSTLPGAIPVEQVDAHREAFGGRLLVAYCTIGYRSGRWAEEARADGLDVRNLAGGVLAWTHTERPLAGADGPSHRVHVYGPTWDLAATDFEAVW